jgi:hypothetical protein
MDEHPADRTGDERKDKKLSRRSVAVLSKDNFTVNFIKAT